MSVASLALMAHGLVCGVADSFKGVKSILRMILKQAGRDYPGAPENRPRQSYRESMNDPRKPARKIMQCCVLNGGVFLCSLFLWTNIVLPIMERVSPSPDVWKYLQPILNSLFSVTWIIPLFLISRVINLLWFQDIADYTFFRTHGRVNRALPLGNLIADLLLSIFIQFLFLIQSLLVTLFPIFGIGELLGFVHRCFLYSLYAFEYRWFSLGWVLHKRLHEIELNWPYFVGFGLPMSIVTSYHDSYFVSGCIFSVFFPVLIVSAHEAVPGGMYSNFPLQLFYPVVKLTDFLLHSVMHREVGRR